MGMIIAGVLVAGFVLNVALGSVAGSPPLGNVAEMVILLCASIAFVTGILKREAQEKSDLSDD